MDTASAILVTMAMTAGEIMCQRRNVFIPNSPSLLLPSFPLPSPPPSLSPPSLLPSSPPPLSPSSPPPSYLLFPLLPVVHTWSSCSAVVMSPAGMEETVQTLMPVSPVPALLALLGHTVRVSWSQTLVPTLRVAQMELVCELGVGKWPHVTALRGV